MTSYYPTTSIIAAAGFSSFRELYRRILQEGCQNDKYYTIHYVNGQGMIQVLVVPVWRVITNVILEISGLRRRR